MAATFLLLLVPVPLVLEYLIEAPPIWIFVAAAVAAGVLAEWMKRATGQLAERAGPAIGGLLNVSFGSLAELILAFFVLLEGRQEVVRAQITGSIIGTSLLGLGLAALLGSVGREKQTFRRDRAGLAASMFILVVIALLLPLVFDLTNRGTQGNALKISEEELSLGVSVVLLLLYAGNLIYTLVTRRDAFAREEERREPEWSLTRSLLVLGLATAAIAWESELVSGALEATASRLGLSEIFLGVVVLALVGTSADIFAAASFARQDRMGLVMSICIGSAIQVALVLAPLLVLLSWLIGSPMTLVFDSPLDLFAIAGAAFIVNAIAVDGETNWFEGLLLVGVYVLLALGFFFTGPA